MARTPRSVARRRAMAIVTVGATLASGSALLAPGTSSASSHREAPYISNDPAVDNTDTYAFVSPDKKSTVTLIANWSPFQDPSGGPTFYPWATDAAYDINIDNNGDGKPDLTYRWTFKNKDTRGTTNHGDNTPGHKDSAGNVIKPSGIPGTFLYNDGAVKNLTDATLLAKQTYTLTVLKYDSKGNVTGRPVTLLANKPVAPSFVGSASMPSYAALRTQAVTAGQIGTNGVSGQSYVGQADDPFFLDLRVFDLLYGAKAGFPESKNDTLKHYNVNTIALQVPKTELAARQDATANPVIGVWSTTSRQSVRTLAKTGAAPTSPEVATSTGAYDAQVSRLGNPLVNEVVVPANLKDYFNRSQPAQDGALLGKVQNPELPYLIEGIYGVPNPNKKAAGNGRPDLVATFLTGISKRVSAGTTYGGLGKGSPNVNLNSLDLNAVAAKVQQAPAEYLRLNMAVAPAARPNRLGVLGGDIAGFPNGRRLADDVVDEALQVFEGVLLPGGQGAGLGDGVNANDKRFLTSFPYIADPTSGSAVTAVKAPVRCLQKITSYRGQVAINVGSISPAIPGGRAAIYRVNSNGTRTLLGRPALNAAGTGYARPFSVREAAGVTSATYLVQLFPAGRYSDAVSAAFSQATKVTVSH